MEYKLKITYYDSKIKDYFYEFCVLENLNWFMLSRYLTNENKTTELDYIIYNGQIIFSGFEYEKKKNKDYTKEDEKNIKEELSNNLIKSIGLNEFSLEILKKINLQTNLVKFRYVKSLFIKNNDKYNFKLCLDDIENFDKCFNIYSNDNILGKIFINGENIKIEIMRDNQIDIVKLCNELSKELKNNKFKTKNLTL